MAKNWHRAHKDSLKIGERIADGMRNLMGSWPFVIGFLAFMTVWMVSRGFGFDPAPYGQLNLALSAMAGIQASLIMIAAKRLDDMGAEQARHDYEVNLDADQRIKEVQKLQREIHNLVKEVHEFTIKNK